MYKSQKSAEHLTTVKSDSIVSSLGSKSNCLEFVFLLYIVFLLSISCHLYVPCCGSTFHALSSPGTHKFDIDVAVSWNAWRIIVAADEHQYPYIVYTPFPSRFRAWKVTSPAYVRLDSQWRFSFTSTSLCFVISELPVMIISQPIMHKYIFKTKMLSLTSCRHASELRDVQYNTIVAPIKKLLSLGFLLYP